MPPTNAIFHALLRPAILQILRASGFYSSRPAVVDSLTELASRYLELLCQETARSAAESADGNHLLGFAEPTVVNVRAALQSIGGFLPERDWEEQDFMEKEDMRGVDEFLAWATGPKTEQIKRVALDEPEEGVADYLTVLKKKHCKMADDTKFMGTLLGKGHDQGFVTVEGSGEVDSMQAWIEKHRSPLLSPHTEKFQIRPIPSGLSSVGTMSNNVETQGA